MRNHQRKELVITKHGYPNSFIVSLAHQKVTSPRLKPATSAVYGRWTESET